MGSERSLATFFRTLLVLYRSLFNPLTQSAIGESQGADENLREAHERLPMHAEIPHAP